MKRAWAIAWRSLRRHRRRNAATVAAVAMGYAGLVLLGGYAVRIERFLRANTVYVQHRGHVGLWMRDGMDRAESDPVRYQLAPAAQQQILALAAADPRVELAARYVRGTALAGNGCATRPATLLGVEPAAHARLMSHPEVRAWTPELAAPASGRWLSEYPRMEEAAAVSAGLAALLGKRRTLEEVRGAAPAPAILDCDGPGRDEQLARDADVQVVSLTYDGALNAFDARMTGTFHAPELVAEEGSMVATVAALQRLFATDRVTYMALYLHRAQEAPAVAADFVRALRAAGVDAEAATYQDERWAPYYVGTMQMLGSLVFFITLLVTAVLVLTVAGAMTLAILERTRELGTWRALGFERGQLAGLFVREALLVGLAGLALGLVLGLGAAQAVNAAGIRFQPPGVAGSIQLLLTPAAWTCAVPAALLLPAIAAATWLVVHAQVRRRPAELLVAQEA